jgi:SAM-dependent methyltransferase
MKESIICGVDAAYWLTYFRQDVSIFRVYQNRLMERYGPLMTGQVLEIGSEPLYPTRKYFPNATSFITSNVGESRGKVDRVVDVTDMRDFADGSLDGIVCISVLEHVWEIHRAVEEMQRVLKPGGRMLVAVPFAFPWHDYVDYWRLSKDAFPRFFDKCEGQELIHLGGMYSSLANMLQRPRRSLRPRALLHKTLGMGFAFLARFDRQDGFPLGYGFSAVKALSSL